MVGSSLAPIIFRSQSLDVTTDVTRGHIGAFPLSKPGLVPNCHLKSCSSRSTTRDRPYSIMLIDPDRGHCIHACVNRPREEVLSAESATHLPNPPTSRLARETNHPVCPI